MEDQSSPASATTLRTSEVTVAVQSAGSQPQHDVSLADHLALNQALALNDPHRKAGQVVVVLAIHIGHDCGFTAKQRHVAGDTTVTDSLNDLFQTRRIVAPHRHIVQKEQWFSTRAQQVVDAHRDQVGANRVMSTGLLSDFQLGSDTVGATDQYRIGIIASEQLAVKVEAKQPGKSAVISNHPRAVGSVH